MKPGTEHRVHEELGTLEERLAAARGKIRFLLDADGRYGKLFQHGLCVAAYFRRVAQNEHGDGATGLHQMARRDQAVTAVVPFATEHYDVPAVGQFAQDEASHGAPRVLHQFDRRDPEAFGGDPIGCAHLVSGEYLHLFSIVEHSRCRQEMPAAALAGRRTLRLTFPSV